MSRPYDACIRCGRITEYGFLMATDARDGLIWGLWRLGVPEGTATELMGEMPDHIDFEKTHFMFELCRRCGKQTDVQVSKRGDLQLGESAPAVGVRHRTLADSQEVWDRDQKELRGPASDHVERGVAVAGTGGSPIDGLPKDVQRLVKPAVRAGWIPTLNGGGHVKFSKDGAESFTVASTPSDWPALKAVRQDMRRVGALEGSS